MINNLKEFKIFLEDIPSIAFFKNGIPKDKYYWDSRHFFMVAVR